MVVPEEWTGTSNDVRIFTQRYTSALERAVRRDPEQYLWLHRRWKHQPKPRKSARRQDGGGGGGARGRGRVAGITLT